MNSNEIRAKFLNFFKDKGHTVIESDLLVPKNDPTLLFTGAGMNQFKEQFMGRNITFKRACSCQKCLRTADLENVGRTPSHHTFFEMLGNFSFGGYFKKEAIIWAWEFMTSQMRLKEDRLWISVYEKDDESYYLWRDEIKVPEHRIVKLGAKDNFWPSDAPSKGPCGPCGPCSEIFYDWQEGSGCGRKTCSPACDCGRFVEVWNLVFTEFERKPDGMLEPLPNKNIDTGMGLERITSVSQNVKTNFETDLFRPIVESCGNDNLVADHIRAVVFAIADGVSPSNEKRGYVVRKLIRRAYLKSKRENPFLFNIVPVIVKIMREAYPELSEKREHITAIVKEEEEKFRDTLRAAMPVLENMLSKSEEILSGEDVFKLVDTYGLPIEAVLEGCSGRGKTADIKSFEQLMEKRKDESRKGSDLASDFIFQKDFFKTAPKPLFSEDMPMAAVLEFILKDGNETNEILEGESAEIILSPQSSLFYAESGGQRGDKGDIIKRGGNMKVLNTFERDGRKVFEVFSEKGDFKKGEKITLNLDFEKKKKTARNHSATHLLQSALRRILGLQVKQAGSFVDDKRLRFDFTYMKKVSERELAKIEELVNTWVEEGVLVTKEIKPLDEAKSMGALSFFGEKYSELVRVVGIGSYSKELCGGTHVDNTKDIGVVKIIAESSVASGIRRIEAVTGEIAEEKIKNEIKEKRTLLKQTLALDISVYTENILSGKRKIDKDVIKDFREKINPAFEEAFNRLKKKEKNLQKQKETDSFNVVREKIDKAASKPDMFGKLKFVSCILKDVDMALLRKAATYLEKKITSGVIMLASGNDAKAYLTCTVVNDLVEKGIDASKIIGSVAGYINGKGGGKKGFATAGGDNPQGLKDAVEAARDIMRRDKYAKS